MADRHGELWTEFEIAAAVEAYVSLLRRQEDGLELGKSDCVRELIEGPLSGRTKKSIEYRFCNISSVLHEHSRSFVAGYSPLNHVGKRPTELIIGQLAEHGLDLRPK